MTYTFPDDAQSWFFEYSKGFYNSDGKLPVPLQIKVEHSRRVAENAKIIASMLNWTDREIEMAEATGWLHDAGRFTQYSEYKTLQDRLSFDHGERAYEILSALNAVQHMPEDQRLCLLQSVRHHNKKEIPEGLRDEELAYLHLIRDADKLDIFHVVRDTIENNRFDDHPEILLNIALDGPVSPAILAEVQQGRQASYKHLQTLADFLLCMVSWMYHFTYAPSHTLIIESGILPFLSSQLPDDADVQKLIEDAIFHIERNTQQPVKEISS